jgi:hypothetical protein
VARWWPSSARCSLLRVKATHRADIFTFSRFDPERNIDFNGWFLVREGGNVLVDPVEMSEHDIAHARELGGVAWIVITNSDHVRAAPELAKAFHAEVAGPAAEREGFPVACDRWLGSGDAAFAGIEIVALDGSKTPGELALVVDGDTLITGDLVRAHKGGGIHLLPDAKLVDRDAALASLRALAEEHHLRAVLVGDGWPLFADAHAHLRDLVERPGP